MLDFSWSHILILLIVALVVVGPKDLPKFLNKIGKSVGKMRRMADQFKNSFDEMARQSELDELRKELAALRDERIGESAATAPPDHFAGHEPPPETGEPIPELQLPEGATPAEPLTHTPAHDEPVTVQPPDVKQ